MGCFILYPSTNKIAGLAAKVMTHLIFRNICLYYLKYPHESAEPVKSAQATARISRIGSILADPGLS